MDSFCKLYYCLIMYLVSRVTRTSSFVLTFISLIRPFACSRSFAFFVCSLAVCQQVSAQRHQVFSENIASLQVVAGTRWMEIPVIQLGGPEVVNISFDDLTHEYRRYTYKVEHCEADWTLSEGLFASEYISGFALDNLIEDIEESLNTNVLYTHYRLQIPNRQCQLKMSGNYRLTVFDENDDETPVLSACFMVSDGAMSVSLQATTNTDVDVNNRHQQIEMKLNLNNTIVVNPAEQIKTVVMQNGRWDNAKVNAKYQYNKVGSLEWNHCRELIFNAGNEYRKFEVLDVDRPSMGVDRMRWDGEYVHAHLFVDEPRRNYVYDEDANGAFYIRNSDNYENDRLSDYVLVHYTLKCDRPVDGRVFINAMWTNDRFEPQYEMEYNEELGQYEAVVFQKLGYYSYQYVMIDRDGAVRTMPTEGDFYETENSYQALVYYRGQSDRTDRLVAYQNIRYNLKNTTHR